MSRSRQHLPLTTILLILATLLIACGAETETENRPGRGMGPGMGPGMDSMGPDGGMMQRHQADLPAAYEGMTNPVDATEESLARGQEIYTTHCQSCHGADGMGAGPAGENLDPPPASIAHTSQMLGDDYLFWRISEGGAMEPFNSAMPAWKQTLSEQERWHVINYIRSLN